MTSAEAVRARYPTLADFFRDYFPNYGISVIDELEILDGAVRAHGAESIAQDLRRLLDDIQEDEEVDPLLEKLGQFEVWWIPGKTDRETVERALERVESWLSRDDVPDIDYHLGGIAPLPSRSRWLSAEDGEQLLAELLGRSAAQVEDWLRAPQGRPRLRLTLAAEREVGVVELPGPERWSPVGEGVTQVVAVLGRGEAGAQVLACFPDLARDPSWARRYPELEQVLGCFFSQAWPQIDERVWKNWIDLVYTLGQPARGRAAEQIADLMQLPEPEVQAAVHALGSYVIPENTRAWLERLHWALSRWAPVRPPEPILPTDGA